MTWNKFDLENPPDGDTFWRIDESISGVSYYHGYYWYKEGIYNYLLVGSSYEEDAKHFSPSELVERNAHWIYPYDIGFPDVMDNDI